MRIFFNIFNLLFYILVVVFCIVFLTIIPQQEYKSPLFNSNADFSGVDIYPEEKKSRIGLTGA